MNRLTFRRQISSHFNQWSALAMSFSLVGCGSVDRETSERVTVPAFAATQPGQPTLAEPNSDPNTNGSCASNTEQCNRSPVTSQEGRSEGIALTGAQTSQEATADSASQVPCTPNLAWCVGNVLNRCSRSGLSVAETPCGACGEAGGVFSCLEQVCEPSAVFCDGPELIGTCSADGTMIATENCPEGTACEGAGSCVEIQCNPASPTGYNNAQATVYWFGQGTNDFGDISCGFGIQSGNPNNGTGDAVTGIADPTLFGAMNTADYRNAAACGTCVQLQQGDRRVTITIVDECPLTGPVPNPICTPGHIDLSRAAWNTLTQAGDGIAQVSWQFAPCVTEDVVSFELKEPDNQYWNEVLVRNHRYEIERLEIEMSPGEWVDAERQSYNYWHPPVGEPDGGDMGTYRVRAWDVNGGAVEAQLELRGGPQAASRQFGCQ